MTVERDKRHREIEPDLDAGAFIGNEAEPAEDHGAVGIESTGPGGQGAIRDDGWQRWPAGHREGAPANDDAVKRKG